MKPAAAVEKFSSVRLRPRIRASINFYICAQTKIENLCVRFGGVRKSNATNVFFFLCSKPTTTDALATHNRKYPTWWIRQTYTLRMWYRRHLSLSLHHQQRALSEAIVPTVFHCGPFAERITTLTAIIHVNECVVFRSVYTILVHYFWLFIIYFSSNLYAVSHTVDFMLLFRRYFFLSVLFSAAASHASAFMTISTQTQHNERKRTTSN